MEADEREKDSDRLFIYVLLLLPRQYEVRESRSLLLVLPKRHEPAALQTYVVWATRERAKQQ